MKAIITGYSDTIGSIVQSCFPEFDWIEIGRKKGIDFTTNTGLEILNELAKDADIFFNIACVENTQGAILKNVFNTYLDQKNKFPKKIINFGSLISFFDSDFQENKHNYISAKLYLEKVHRECCLYCQNNYDLPYAIPNSTLIRFGFMIKEDDRRGQLPFTSKSQLEEVIKFVVSSKSNISNIDVT